MPAEPTAAAPLYFSHIPKTAGTSFTAIVDRFFPVERICPAQLWWDVGDVAAVRAANYDLIRGHFGMAAWLLSERPLHTLTLLRDPVSLAHSTYQYVKRESGTGMHDYVHEKQLTFEQFLTDPATSNLTNNRLVKGLCFGLGATERDLQRHISPDNFNAIRRVWNQPRRNMTPADLAARAEALLAECHWFGLVEAFDWSLLMLCHLLDRPPVGTTPKLNRHLAEAEISAAARAIIADKNPWDVALYDCAKMQFEQRKAQFMQTVGAGLGDFDQVQDRVDAHYQSQHPLLHQGKWPEQLDYDFSQALLGQNWHQREWAAPEQKCFRWTGPEPQTVIDFWLTPGRRRMQLHFIDVVGDDYWSDLRLSINDHPVSWELKKTGEQGHLEWTIEPHMTKNNGLLRLKIMNQTMARHQHVFGSSDRRMVGMAVARMTTASA